MAEISPLSRAQMARWRSFPPFAALGEAALAAIAARCQIRHLGAGAVLFQRGDPGGWMVALIDGRVRLDISTSGGRVLALRNVEPGECFGELTLFDGAARSATATALCPLTAYVLHRADYENLADDRPEIPAGMVRWLARRLRETTDQLAAVALLPLEARTAWFLLGALKSLHGVEESSDLPLMLSVNQSEIALVLGASRPKVNQAIQELVAHGAVARGRGHLICRADLLARRIETLSS